MKKLGYEVMREIGIPGRRYFRKDNPAGVRTHQVHTFETGAPEVTRHLAFRDYLIAHPEDAQEYSNLKRNLGANTPTTPTLTWSARMCSSKKSSAALSNGEVHLSLGH